VFGQENAAFKNSSSLLGGSDTYSRHLGSSSSSDDDIFSSIDKGSKAGKTSFYDNNGSKRSFLSCAPSCHASDPSRGTREKSRRSSRDTLPGSGTMSSRADSVIDRSVSSASSHDYSTDSLFEYDNVEHHVQMAQEWLLKMKSAFLGPNNDGDDDDDSATMDGTVEPSTVQCEYAGVLGRLKIDINKNKN
jgi:hypothetical protein